MSIDRRVAPRIQTSLPINLITSDGTKLEGMISDISASGLGVTGDRQLVENLLPNTTRPDAFIPIKIDCKFEVPFEDRSTREINVNCAIVYASRAEQDHYKLGMQFAEFKDSCEISLAQYVLKLSRTAPLAE